MALYRLDAGKINGINYANAGLILTVTGKMIRIHIPGESFPFIVTELSEFDNNGSAFATMDDFITYWNANFTALVTSAHDQRIDEIKAEIDRQTAYFQMDPCTNFRQISVAEALALIVASANPVFGANTYCFIDGEISLSDSFTMKNIKGIDFSFDTNTGERYRIFNCFSELTKIVPLSCDCYLFEIIPDLR